jgi:hypothetical protein
VVDGDRDDDHDNADDDLPPATHRGKSAAEPSCFGCGIQVSSVVACLPPSAGGTRAYRAGDRETVIMVSGCAITLFGSGTPILEASQRSFVDTISCRFAMVLD